MEIQVRPGWPLVTLTLRLKIAQKPSIAWSSGPKPFYSMVFRPESLKKVWSLGPKALEDESLEPKGKAACTAIVSIYFGP